MADPANDYFQKWKENERQLEKMDQLSVYQNHRIRGCLTLVYNKSSSN